MEKMSSEDEIEGMKEAGRMASKLLNQLGEMVEPGITTGELDDFAQEFAEKQPVTKHAPKGYRGFPRSICTSVNESVCHEIPGERALQSGDIVGVDVTPVVGEFHGDTCATFPVGEIDDATAHLLEVTAECLQRGLKQVRAGKRIGDIGAAIQNYAESQGCSVVRQYSGHGIGREFHADPSIPHYGQFNTGARLIPGMSFTIEPMINLGAPETILLEDDWTAVTQDGRFSAQFEHTVVVQKDGPLVTTALKNWKDQSPGGVIKFG